MAILFIPKRETRAVFATLPLAPEISALEEFYQHIEESVMPANRGRDPLVEGVWEAYGKLSKAVFKFTGDPHWTTLAAAARSVTLDNVRSDEMQEARDLQQKIRDPKKRRAQARKKLNKLVDEMIGETGRASTALDELQERISPLRRGKKKHAATARDSVQLMGERLGQLREKWNQPTQPGSQARKTSTVSAQR